MKHSLNREELIEQLKELAAQKLPTYLANHMGESWKTHLRRLQQSYPLNGGSKKFSFTPFKQKNCNISAVKHSNTTHHENSLFIF